ncbi:type VII secretion protein EssB [Peribacillus asahii]|uniref:Type VII secretion protein EssB n=1 Tax=Peribacillus asahii TaxID=228899 RepID=A0A398BIP5_9BACI|nr:type VII secretion protein EssB [Peribacillus asahii]RID89387.1 type VII secretion protein EssB [Peribacillus asahii]
MSEKKQSYLEKQLEAVIKKEKNTIQIIFQREKIRLDDALEMEMLKYSDSSVKKEITLTEAELNLIIEIPSSYISFTQLKKKDEKSRWIFASQLIKKVENHSLNRLHVIVCPENIVVDESLTPYFLHYGVKESLPPYEQDEERLLQELRATVAEIVDKKYSFFQYLHLYQTLELSPIAAKILAASNINELQERIREHLTVLEQRAKQEITVAKKKWNVTRYTALGLLVALVPALLFSLYTLVLAQPKQSAFINSQEYFLKNQYSEVINSLLDYEVEDMPNVVQYELAQSYIMVSKDMELMDNQKDTLQRVITLQTDPQYYDYWIQIGRGNAKEALDIAYSLEDITVILYGLYQYNKEVKADDELKTEEKQQKLKEIQSEIDEYKREWEEEQEKRKAEEAAKKEAEAKAKAEQIQQEKNSQKPKEPKEPQKKNTEPSESNSN